MTELVTGEAVVLDLRLAKLASRAVAIAMDLVVQVVLLVTVELLLGSVLLTGVDTALAAAIALVTSVAVVVGYPVVFETLTRGRSLGKLALGLRVVREDGGPIRFRQALVRGLLAVPEFWITWGALALICSLASSRGKRLGDFLAGTVVVRERMPATAHVMPTMPPPLADWASRLDLSRVPDDLALAARQYLARIGELDPQVRATMGARLLDQIRVATGSWPPDGAPAWAVLSGVLAERRRRELMRMAPQSQGPQPPWGQQPPWSQQPPWGQQPPSAQQPPWGRQAPATPPPAPPSAPGNEPAPGAAPSSDDNPFAPPG
ncbi:MAG: hypothetical protein QOE01_3249 [Actinomycetota bacterium]|nr:hypothetical protein [Actinomycetota bacterium]